jgi:hypothetical protein
VRDIFVGRPLILSSDFEGDAANASQCESRVSVLHRSTSKRGKVRHAVPAIVLLGFALSGCAATVADNLPLIGLPANAPARPETAGSYPPVHDVPQPRQEEMMSVAEQTKLANELMETRAKRKATAASDAAEIAASTPLPAKPKQVAAKKKAEKPQKDAQ